MGDDSISTAMLMTAGLGTRMYPFTQYRPKALIPVMGIPAAQYALDSLIHSGVQRIVANIHHLPDLSRTGILALDHGGAEVLISDESQLLRGSAGAMVHARELLGEGPFFYVNGDVLSDIDWQALAFRHARLKRQWGVTMTIGVTPSRNGGKYREIHFDPTSGLMTGMGNLVAGRPFFIGAAVIEPSALSRVPLEGVADFVSLILEPEMKANRVGVFQVEECFWHDIGSPDLWLRCHLDLIHSLEIGRFRTPAARLWRKRIEDDSYRLMEGVWLSKRSPRRITNASNWVGPCYWDSEGDIAALLSQRFGPRSVLYGVVPSSAGTLRDGIGCNGHWVAA